MFFHNHSEPWTNLLEIMAGISGMEASWSELVLRHRQFLIKQVEPDYGLVDKLYTNKVLSDEEKADINAENTIYKRNCKLLEYIQAKGQYDGFSEALKNSNQTHVVNYLEKNGIYAFDDEWPLLDRVQSILQANHETLIEIFDVQGLVIRLYSAGIINSMQKDFIFSKKATYKRNRALLDILSRRSMRDYKRMIICLRESNQSHIAQILEEGGVVVRLHAEVPNDRTEDEIISHVVDVLENRSTEESRRILQGALNVIAMKKGMSIVVYVYCKTIDELLKLQELKTSGKLVTVLQNLFIDVLLFAKFTDVTVENQKSIVESTLAESRLAEMTATFNEEEYEKSKMYFLIEEERMNEIVSPQDQLEHFPLKPTKGVDRECEDTETQGTPRSSGPKENPLTVSKKVPKGLRPKVPPKRKLNRIQNQSEPSSSLTKSLQSHFTTDNITPQLSAGPVALRKCSHDPKQSYVKKANITRIREIFNLIEKQIQAEISIKVTLISKTTPRPGGMLKECFGHALEEFRKMSTSHAILTSEFDYLRRKAGQFAVTERRNELLKENLQHALQELETQKASVKEKAKIAEKEKEGGMEFLLREIEQLKLRNNRLEDENRHLKNQLLRTRKESISAGKEISNVDIRDEQESEMEYDYDNKNEGSQEKRLPAEKRSPGRFEQAGLSINSGKSESNADIRAPGGVNVLIIGLYDGSTITDEVLKINLQNPSELYHVEKVPIYMQIEATASVYHNTVYIVGLGIYADKIWKYESKSGWNKCASLKQGRRRHCAAFVDEILYICGGFFDKDKSAIDSVEAYNAVDSTCKAVGKLVFPVQNSGNCVAYKKSLYIFGGQIKDDEAVSDVQVYDTVQNTCHLLSNPMPCVHNFMRATLFRESVILLSGCNCLLYDFTTETWQAREDFKTGVIHFGLAKLNGRIYVIGGGEPTTDANGKPNWICRDDVRSIAIEEIIEDKPVQWIVHGRLSRPCLVYAFAHLKEQHDNTDEVEHETQIPQPEETLYPG